MLVIWRFIDGNRAHEKQSAALVSGLEQCLGADALDCRTIDCGAVRISLWGGLPAALQSLPRPDFIIGAGHRTHWPVLRARRLCGGRSVVIMQPSLLLSWFDFVIAPEHDRPPALENVILTQGALAEPLPELPLEADRGLLLFGGPSRHFHWDAAKVAAVSERLLQQPLKWVLADSRRTPEGTLEQYVGSGAELVPWQQSSPGWLAEQMARAGHIWITGDSVSMVFEALQSRAQIGVIAQPSRRPRNKIRGAMQRLLDQGLVAEQVEAMSMDASTADARSSREPFNQQISCARALLRRCGIKTIEEHRYG
ncbi:mitochondrial fission ELM1 family protein [Microbulbifer sp. CAU 1566]|uniref:ELM1/GtrOC1 family putative glycosyltransferase n=1 Tax=Microbulbifer sp. CAU 1566 TaxID=2933269 RepID=UPI00200483B8|nr:mitochondrial fission ELM1 family protein [Microbulbifer sp. CAU 1566]